MKRPPRRSALEQQQGNGQAPVQIPPLPTKNKHLNLAQLAGSAQDIPAALVNKPIEPTPGLGGKLTFYFGGTGDEKKAFTFRTPRAAQTSPWRKLVAGPAKELLAVILEAMAIDMEGEKGKQGIARMVQIVEEHIITVPDVLTDLLLEFAPELKEQGAEIRDLAFDEEIAQAFITACKVAFPLASIQSLLRAGEAMSGTSSN